MTPTSSGEAILAIEDDRDLADLLRIHLRDLGYRLDLAHDGRRGLEQALAGEYALVILDLMLPGLDGLEVCKGIRAADPYVPILMLTARSDELDKVLGLELGADDYLTKPFSVRELLARVKALFRRIALDRAALRPAGAVECGPLRVDPVKRKVTLGAEEVALTAKEFDLLFLFAQHPGRAYSREELLDLVWGYGYSGYSHTVNSHINRIRGKIEADPSTPRFIKTVWGLGYRFAEPEEFAA